MAVTAAEILVRVGADVRQFQAAMAGVNARIAGVSKSFAATGAALSATGAKLTRRLTLPVAAAAGGATKLALDFDQAFTRIRALVGASEEQIAEYKKGVLDLAREGAKGPKELADAMFFITSSGFEGASALKVLEASSRAASAGLGSTVTVADAVTSAVNAYGEAALPAAKATDILLAAVREGKAEPEELAGSIGRVIAPAQAMGVEFEEVAGALAALSLVGIDAAEGTTAVRAALTSILKPAKETRKFLDESGESIAGLRKEIKDKGLVPTFGRLAEKFKGNQDAIGKLFPNVRALNGFLALTGANAAKTAKIMDGVADSTGDTNVAFAAAMEDSANKISNAWAQIQVAAIRAGAVIAPLVGKIAQKIAQLVQAFSDLPRGTKVAIAAFVAFAAGVGPVLSIIGGVLKLIGGLGIAFGLLLTPIGLIVAAIVGIGAAITVLAIKNEAFRAKLVEVWQKIRDAIGPVIDFAVQKFREISDAISRRSEEIRETISRVLAAIRAIWSAVWPTLEKIVRGVWNSIKIVVETALEAIGNILRIVMALIRGDWGEAWSALKDLVSGVMKGIKRLIRNTLTTLASIVVPLAKQIALGIWQGIQRAWQLVLGVMKRIKDAIVNALKALPGIVLGLAIGIGKAIIDGIWQGFQDGIGWLRGQIESGLGFIKSLNPFSSVERGGADYIGRPLVEGASKGFRSRLPQLRSDIEGGLLGVGKMIENIISARFGKPERTISRIDARRQAEDLIQAVKDAERRLTDVRKDGKKDEIVQAERDLARAREDITLASLRRQADAEQRMRDRIIGVLERARDKFRSVWDRFTGDALRAFDLLTDRGLRGLERDFDAAASSIEARFDSVFDSIEAGRRSLTPAELAIRGIEEGRSAARIAEEIADAEKELIAARKSKDKERIANAQKRLDEARLDEQLDALRKQADAERAERERSADEARRTQESIRDRELADLRSAFDQRRIEFEAAREQERRDLEARLTVLGEHLVKYKGAWRKATQKVQEILDRFNVSLDESGLLGGLAFADGIRRAIPEIEAAAKAAANVVARYLKLKSPAETGPLSDLDRWWRGFAPTLLAGLDTRAIERAANLAITPQVGTFATAGGAPMVIEVHSHVSLDGREIAETVRREQVRIGKRNPDIFGGRA